MVSNTLPRSDGGISPINSIIFSQHLIFSPLGSWRNSLSTVGVALYCSEPTLVLFEVLFRLSIILGTRVIYINEFSGRKVENARVWSWEVNFSKHRSALLFKNTGNNHFGRTWILVHLCVVPHQENKLFFFSLKTNNLGEASDGGTVVPMIIEARQRFTQLSQAALPELPSSACSLFRHRRALGA